MRIEFILDRQSERSLRVETAKEGKREKDMGATEPRCVFKGALKGTHVERRTGKKGERRAK